MELNSPPVLFVVPDEVVSEDVVEVVRCPDTGTAVRHCTPCIIQRVLFLHIKNVKA